MARLPEPVMERIDSTWPEDSALREMSFSSILGQAIRKRATAEREMENKNKESTKLSTT